MIAHAGGWIHTCKVHWSQVLQLPILVGVLHRLLQVKCLILGFSGKIQHIDCKVEFDFEVRGKQLSSTERGLGFKSFDPCKGSDA